MHNRQITLKNILLILALITISVIGSPRPVWAEDSVIVGPDGYNQLQEAIETVSTGGTVFIQAGQYQVPRLVINRSLIIRGEEGVTLLAAEDTTDSGTKSGWIRVESGCQAKFENLCLDGNGKNISNALYGLGTLLVKNCSFTNIKYPLNKGRAIVLVGDNSMIDGCSFSEIGRAGIYLYSSQNILLQNNTYTGKGASNYLDYGIEAAGGAQVTIHSNTIRGCGGLTSTGTYSAAILISTEKTSCPSSAVIENNVIQHNLYGVLIGVTGNDNSQVQMSNNIIADNQSKAVFSYSREISAENNYWGVNGPILQGANAVPDWLDICPWAADTTDENGDGVFDRLAYLLDLQWTDGGTELELTGVEPGTNFSLNFSASLNKTAPQTSVSYILEWSTTDPNNTLDGLTINRTPLQNNVCTITDTLQPGQQKNYDVNVIINTPGTYTVSLYGVRLLYHCPVLS